jgi:16S rRNA (guanine966-N2)-methyltransferase
LSFPDVAGLRPTPDRVRETLFNWLGQDLSGLRALDLYAGSGALGFEALSRGAREAVMIEHAHPVIAALRSNATLLGATNARIVECDALEFLAAPSGECFDVVFVDPPYASGLVERSLERMPALLAPGGRVYAESAQRLALPGWKVLRQARAGAVHFHLLIREEHDQSGLSGHV